MTISDFKINLLYMLGDIAETSFASTSHANQENQDYSGRSTDVVLEVKGSGKYIFY